MIDGVSANLVAMRTRDGEVLSGAHFYEVPSISRAKPSLTLFARCKTEADCADIPTIARSLEFH